MEGADRYELAAESEYDFPERRDDAYLLGVDAEGDAVYYDPEGHTRLVGDRAPDAPLPDWAVEEDLTPDVDVSDLIADVDETLGWAALTDYAHGHLPASDEAV